MRLGQAAIVGAMLSMALAMSACGAESTPAGALDAAPSTGAARATASCRSQLRPFVVALDALRKDLAAGLSYDQYLAELRGARAGYRRIPADRLQLGCLVAAGAPAERAADRYIEAVNAWGECLATAACETASIEPRLQREWARASELLSAAQAGL